MCLYTLQGKVSVRLYNLDDTNITHFTSMRGSNADKNNTFEFFSFSFFFTIYKALGVHFLRSIEIWESVVEL